MSFTVQVADYQGNSLEPAKSQVLTRAGLIELLLETKTGELPSTGQRNRVKTFIVFDTTTGKMETFTRNVWVIVEDATGQELDTTPVIVPTVPCGICAEDIPASQASTRFRDAMGTERRICKSCIASPAELV